jgi:hypothetical protein
VTDFNETGLFIEEPTISPDGKYLVYTRSHGGSSLVADIGYAADAVFKSPPVTTRETDRRRCRCFSGAAIRRQSPREREGRGWTSLREPMADSDTCFSRLV